MTRYKIELLERKAREASSREYWRSRECQLFVGAVSTHICGDCREKLTRLFVEDPELDEFAKKTGFNKELEI